VLIVVVSGAHGIIVPRVNLTETGPEVSAVSWGHLTLEKLETPENVLAYLHTCLDLGITLLDTADIYPPLAENGFNMNLLGQAFLLEPSIRYEFEIVAKVGIVSIIPFVVNTTRDYLVEAINSYFAALHTDYLDILLIHQPDPNLNAPEMAELFDSYIESGQIRYFGVSNWDATDFDLLQSLYSYTLVTNEVEFSVITPDETALLHMIEVNTKPLVWGPLGGDPLGRDNRLFTPPFTPKENRIKAVLDDVAEEIGNNATQDQVALSFVMYHPAKSIPIVGTMNVDRLFNQVNGALNVVLPSMTQEQYDRIMDVANSV